MALVNEKGEYFRIPFPDIITGDSVRVEVYENREHRQQGETRFHRKYFRNIHIPLQDILSQSLPLYPGKSIRENLHTLIYEYVKTLPEFSSMQSI